MKPPKDRPAIVPVFDSRHDEPQYNVTTRVGDRTVLFQAEIDDPFGRTTVTVGWRDVLREWRRRRPLRVTVIIDGTPAVTEAVLELDGNYRGRAGSARRREADAEIAASLGMIP